MDTKQKRTRVVARGWFDASRAVVPTESSQNLFNEEAQRAVGDKVAEELKKEADEYDPDCI